MNKKLSEAYIEHCENLQEYIGHIQDKMGIIRLYDLDDLDDIMQLRYLILEIQKSFFTFAWFLKNMSEHFGKTE